MAHNINELQGDEAGDSAAGGGSAKPSDRAEKVQTARRMSANTGSWLNGRSARFSAEAFGTLNWDGGISSSTFRSS
jgi:hypothetical protein